MPRSRRGLLALAFFACLAWLPPGRGAGHSREDHEEARRAVARGELKPLSEILARVEKEFEGRIIEVELEHGRNGRLIYELELLTSDGRVLELRFDGRTGERLAVRGGRQADRG